MTVEVRLAIGRRSGISCRSGRRLHDAAADRVIDEHGLRRDEDGLRCAKAASLGSARHRCSQWRRLPDHVAAAKVEGRLDRLVAPAPARREDARASSPAWFGQASWPPAVFAASTTFSGT